MGRDMRQELTPEEHGLFVAVIDALVDERVISGRTVYRWGAFHKGDYDGTILEMKTLLDKLNPDYHQWPPKSRKALYEYWISRGWSRDHFVKAWCLDTDDE